MDEYIKKSDIGLTDFEIILCKGSYKEALLMLFDKIENLPAADVWPVVRGKWEDCTEYNGEYRCSVCKKFEGHKRNFCPNCGAKMEEN